MSWRYVVRRLIEAGASVGVILLVTFALIQFVPGDPVLALLQEGQNPQELEEVRARYGLDEPLPVQFLTYVGNVAQGDLGDSLTQGKPVKDAIAERIWPTLILSATALAISVPTGILLGFVAAWRPFGRFDFGVRLLALVGNAIPSFFLAQMAILFIAFRLDLLPLFGMTNPRVENEGLAHVADVAYHLILPASVLAFGELTLVTRLTRSGLLAEAGKDYVRTALAKGVDRRTVMARHSLPNAMLPVVTVVGTRVGFLLAGAVIIEDMFAWPGLGTLLVGATRNADTTLILGLVLMLSSCLIVANLLTDLFYAWLDPRIRYR